MPINVPYVGLQTSSVQRVLYLAAGSGITLAQDLVAGTLTLSAPNALGGTGTPGKLPKWLTAASLTDSILQESAGQIGVGGVPNDVLDVKGLFRITGQGGMPNYARFDNTANSGKIWRFGNTGVGPATSFDIYNQTDNITGISFASATGRVTLFANVATVGWGLPAIYATGHLVGITTGAVQTVCTYTPTTDSDVLVGATLFLSSGTVTVTATISYTSADSGAPAAFTVTSVSAVSLTIGAAVYLRAKANTAVTLQTTASSTPVNYNASGSILQVA